VVGWPARSIEGISIGVFAGICTPGLGQPGLPTRLVAGLFIPKHVYTCRTRCYPRAGWKILFPNSFCGELSFCSPVAVRPLFNDALAPTPGRGAARQVALIPEGLSIAHKTGVLATRDLERVVVEATVRAKALRIRSARLCHRALKKIGRSRAAPPGAYGRAIGASPSTPQSWSGDRTGSNRDAHQREAPASP
jgi:hypothetical protein